MSKTIVVLDIGATHITGIEAIPVDMTTGKRPKITRMHRTPLQAGIISNGNIVSATDLKDALKRFWKQGNFGSKKVVLTATGESYESRVAEDLKWAPPEDFKRVLPYTIRDQRLPFDVEKFWLDSHTLDEYYNVNDPEDPDLYKKVLVTGVSKEYLENLLRAVEGAGLRPLALDAILFNLIRTYQVLPNAIPDAPVVSIDLGADVATIVIHRQGQPMYAFSTAPLGGADVTETLSRDLNLLPPAAEMLKISYSLTPEERKTQQVTVIDPDTNVSKTVHVRQMTAETVQAGNRIIAQKISNLNEVIVSSLEEAFARRGGTPAAEIVLSGGHAGLFRLADRLRHQLEIPVRFAQPFTEQELRKLPAGIAPHMVASAYGLLLGQGA